VLRYCDGPTDLAEGRKVAEPDTAY